MTRTSRPRPLESFSPKLMELLLRGAVAPVRLLAQERPPKLKLKGIPLPADELPRTVQTRWHQVVFDSQQAAQKFRDFMRVAQRLHALRASMKEYGHPDTARAYAVSVGVDDSTGSLNVKPGDAVLDDLLDEILDAAGEAPGGAPQTSASQAEHDSPMPSDNSLDNLIDLSTLGENHD